MCRIISAYESFPTIRHIMSFSTKYVILVSPYTYIDVPKDRDFISQFEKDLDDVLSRDIQVLLLFGKNDKYKRYIDKKFPSKNFPNLYSRWVENLHCKIYMNENECLITSYNISNSVQSNFDLGILFNKEANTNLFRDVFVYLKQIYHSINEDKLEKFLFINDI